MIIFTFHPLQESGSLWGWRVSAVMVLRGWHWLTASGKGRARVFNWFMKSMKHIQKMFHRFSLFPETPYTNRNFSSQGLIWILTKGSDGKHEGLWAELGPYSRATCRVKWSSWPAAQICVLIKVELSPKDATKKSLINRHWPDQTDRHFFGDLKDKFCTRSDHIPGWSATCHVLKKRSTIGADCERKLRLIDPSTFTQVSNQQNHSPTGYICHLPTEQHAYLVFSSKLFSQTGQTRKSVHCGTCKGIFCWLLFHSRDKHWTWVSGIVTLYHGIAVWPETELNEGNRIHTKTLIYCYRQSNSTLSTLTWAQLIQDFSSQQVTSGCCIRRNARTSLGTKNTKSHGNARYPRTRM